MKNAQITAFIFDNGEFFAAHLNNGGVCVGINGVVALNVPAGHELHAQIAGLTLATVEDFIDAQIEAGRIDLRLFA